MTTLQIRDWFYDEIDKSGCTRSFCINVWESQIRYLILEGKQANPLISSLNAVMSSKRADTQNYHLPDSISFKDM